MDHYDAPKALNELVRRLGDRTVLVLPNDNRESEGGMYRAPIEPVVF